jgi:hypothetical protein
LAGDPRFDRAMARIIYRGLTGDEPLRPPGPNADHAEARKAMFEVQSQFFERVGRTFRANGHDVRVLFKEILRSPWLRARDYEGEADEPRLAQLDMLGMRHPLTPEQLNRKLTALFPYPWRPDPDARDYLLNGQEYRMLYGGIDSDDVIRRLRDPNGIMANIQMRMANEIACRVTAQDFALPPESRRLFPGVEIGFMPEDDNGFAITAAAESLRAGVVHLHAYLLDEEVDLHDPEIEATWLLWSQVWREGRDGIIGGEAPTALPSDCQHLREYWNGADLPEEARIANDPGYTIRAWMAVISYLLMDYRFLYQ